MLKQLAPICLFGTALEMVWLGTLALGPLRERTPPFLGLMAAAFLICVWAYFRVPLATRAGAVVMLAFALLFRLTLLPAPPWQSEDVYRYLWDARVAASGVDPFAFPPEAADIRHLRDARIYPMLNSKPYVTAYPPVSQLLFRACHGIFSDSVVAMKALFCSLEFGALLLAWRILRRAGRALEPLYLVAWNPFFVFEFSHSGHSDSAMIFLLLLAVYLIFRSHVSLAMASYAGAVLAKLHPALWFPFFLRRTGWKPALAGAAAGMGLALLYFTPASLARYLDSLRLYYRLFEFNAGIHYLLCYLGRIFFRQSWDQHTGIWLAAALLITSAALWRFFPVRGTLDLLHAGFWTMTADLCLATTVHPWYLSWAAFALPFFPYAFMTYWTGAIFVSYLAYQFRPVHEPAWGLILQYVPMYALMIWEIKRRGPVLEKLRRRLS